jgi:hypothetical protein
MWLKTFKTEKVTSFSFTLQKLLDVQDFLKVPRRELKSHQVKIHKGSLLNYVENWDEVQKSLKGTHYESLLSGDY